MMLDQESVASESRILSGPWGPAPEIRHMLVDDILREAGDGHAAGATGTSL